VAENLKIEYIPVNQLERNPWNPNIMDDETMERLKKEIEENGIIDPIQVVKIEEGKYRVIGGEHRWQIVKALGHETIPCVVLGERFKDEDLQKFVTVRLNVIRGRISPEKFIQLYEEMSEKYGADQLRELMGVVDETEWERLTKGVRQALKDSGVPQELVNRFDSTVREAQTVDDVSNILNNLFSEYGQDLKYNFMCFSLGKNVLYIRCSDDLFNKVRRMVEFAKKHKVAASSIFDVMIADWESIDIDSLPKIGEDEEEEFGY